MTAMKKDILIPKVEGVYIAVVNEYPLNKPSQLETRAQTSNSENLSFKHPQPPRLLPRARHKMRPAFVAILSSILLSDTSITYILYLHS